MSEQEQEQLLKITPTREQWTRFILYHVHVFSPASFFRLEGIARKLSHMQIELETTGSITLTNEDYMIAHWQNIAAKDFVLDAVYPNKPTNPPKYIAHKTA